MKGLHNGCFSRKFSILSRIITASNLEDSSMGGFIFGNFPKFSRIIILYDIPELRFQNKIYIEVVIL